MNKLAMAAIGIALISSPAAAESAPTPVPAMETSEGSHLNGHQWPIVAAAALALIVGGYFLFRVDGTDARPASP